MADKIEIYGQKYCSFCDKARELCEQRDLPYTYYEIGVDVDVSEFARLFPDKKTVPQIMINGTYIGGFSELNAELTL
jgi:glutaredoxin 1